MRNLIKFIYRSITGIIFMLPLLHIFGTYSVFAQGRQSITGKVIDSRSNQAVPYATVALITSSDSKIAGGVLSDDKGIFRIAPVTSGRYWLQVSSIGYIPVNKSIEVQDDGPTDAGIVFLKDTAIILEELVVVGDRVKAKSEGDRTVYNVTERIVNASNTGTDVLKLIPGIQIDMMQNISLEGSRNILIFVDGREHDKSFVAQLNPNRIDKIEIISVPPSNYDGNLTGAINIILKKDRHSGINGQILAEIPTSVSEVYIFPTYSLSYGFKKLNLYTSYSGELTYLNQLESNSREFWNNFDTSRITTIQYLKQKNWSHRFHYGFDYFLSKHDQINFYAYYNPWSRELDGMVDLQMSGKIDNSWQAKKDDIDKSTGSFYSLYYKHIFNRNGSEITADISSYYLRAGDRTNYIQENSGNEIIVLSNSVKPVQNILSIKIDYSTIILKKLNFNAGIKSKVQASQDRLSDFEHRENIIAGYGNMSYKLVKLDISTGLRFEKATVYLLDSLTNSIPAFLPYANFRYKLTSKQSIQLSTNRSVRRPNIYQLNPYISVSDPYSIALGNPTLKPEFLSSVFLEHSFQFNGNYISSRLFWKKATNVINNLTFINGNDNFEVQVQNLGILKQYGLQFSGSFKVSILTLNPYVRLFELYTYGNSIAKLYSIENRIIPGLESGLSAIASFKHDLSFSMTLQYNSPNTDIQTRSFSDLNYFLSAEKTIKQKIKVGIASAIPFTRSFIYQGAEINGSDFNSRYEGRVQLSVIPIWFRLGYQFSSGEKRDKIERSKEELENLPKKGF